MFCDEASGMAAGFGVQDIVDIALPPDGDVFRPVLGDWRELHA
jgi:hypothetical protein